MQGLSLKSYIKLLLLILIPILASGCSKNEFLLDFSLPAEVSTSYKISYYASDKRGGLQIETAAVMTAGKCQLKGFTRRPTLGWIFYGQSSLPAAIFYAERGDKIEISGDGQDPMDWKIEGGGDINNMLTQWRLENKNQISDVRNRRPGDDDISKVKKLNAAVAKFVKANADSPAAALILISYFDASADRAGFSQLLKLVQDQDYMENLLPLLTRQDLASATDANPDMKSLKVRDMVVQSYANNIDTLRLESSSAPAIVCFWRRNDNHNEANLDSLKRLASWRKDSASMLIADISLSSDSVTWSFSARRDSLRHTVRAIAPRGLADEQIMRLGITSTPWWIVTSGKGLPLYSGPDAAEACKKFRSLKPRN